MLLLTRQLDCKTYIEKLCKKIHVRIRQKAGYLIIQKADKNNTVAITEKNGFINKMKEIISDTSKFEQINIKEDKRLNFLLKSEKNIIDLIKDFRR